MMMMVMMMMMIMMMMMMMMIFAADNESTDRGGIARSCNWMNSTCAEKFERQLCVCEKPEF